MGTAPPVVPPSGIAAFWVRFTRALKGWKFYVGAVVFYTPEIMDWAANFLPIVAPGADSAVLAKRIGGILVSVGLIHKFMKFSGPIDRRDDVRRARSIKKLDDVMEDKADAKRENPNRSGPPSL